MIIEIPTHSDFSIHNIPFGIFSTPTSSPRVGVAIGEHILDLVEVGNTGVFDFNLDVLNKSYLNAFIALGKSVTSGVRRSIQAWLQDDNGPLTAAMFVKQTDATMHMPIKVGDYTDFYSSIEHATNVGKLFRDPENALLPNWRHLPVGYHGRASSIVVSGTDIVRPKGQTRPDPEAPPVYGPCKLLDFELEMGFVIGKSSQLGQTITTAEAPDYIFGMVLFNDWSARDIQKWEYVPLGPFLGKSFASSVSPWVVTMDALMPFKVAGPKQEPEVLPYLQCSEDYNFDINLEVGLAPKGQAETIISRSNYKYMYWNQLQQLAHHTVNGCNVNIGDMMASGTISGKDEKSYGSLLEITFAGRQPLTLETGEERKFLQNGDELTLRGYAEKDGKRVGFGSVSGVILPSNS